jgi:hypothetical protein
VQAATSAGSIGQRSGPRQRSRWRHVIGRATRPTSPVTAYSGGAWEDVGARGAWRTGLVTAPVRLSAGDPFARVLAPCGREDF